MCYNSFMSENLLQKLKKADLVAIATAYDVEHEGRTVAEIREELDALGITWEMYKELVNAEKEKYMEEATQEAQTKGMIVRNPVPQAKAERSVLMKMTRKNGTYEIRGYKFTRTNPYCLVTEEDADFLTENVKGFAIASPKEVKNFYS